MFSGESKNIMMPFLLNIINGTSNEVSLNPTKIISASINGSFNPFEENLAPEEKRVAIIQVHHPIFKYDQFCGPKGTQSIIRILESWKNDDSIVGVVMDYNSGGGQVSGTREASRYIFNYPKPIVSYTNDLAGSAAFYMYAAGSYHYVNQYADFLGCIGTMWYSVDLEGIIEKNGGKVNEIYSDLSPEKNNHSRTLKSGDERPIVEKILNPDASIFHSDIKEYMPSISDNALKGDIFSPELALEEGLADSFGTLTDAVNKVFELSKAKKSSNSKSNTNMNTKSLPKVEAALGLDAPLALNENGSYLNEEQLDTLEGRLDTLESENSTLQTQLTEAQTAQTTAVATVQTQLTAATNSITAAEASVNTILANAGLPVTGTLEEKLTAINGKAEAFGKSDGSTHTKLKVDASGAPKNDFVDAEAGHNKMANEILKG
jgi:protease IV